MDRISPVTVALIEERPQTAVGAMAKMDASDAAAFLETLPTRHAAMIFSKLSARSGSEIIAQMEPVNGAAIFPELDYQMTASIVRLLAEVDREKLLKALPRKLSKDLLATLTYPADTVGAKMLTNIVIMAADQTSADALAELRQKKRAKTGVAYVVDGSRKLLGIVSAGELLQSPNEALLSEAIDRSITPISARARLSTVKSLPTWNDYEQMPVVNRQKILIGALHRRVFRQPAEKDARDKADDQIPSIFTAVASAFATSAVGLADFLTNAGTGLDQLDGSQSQGVQGDNT